MILLSRGVDVTPCSGGVEVIPLFVSDETSIDNEVVTIGNDLVLATPSSAFDELIQVMPEIIKFRENNYS